MPDCGTREADQLRHRKRRQDSGRLGTTGCVLWDDIEVGAECVLREAVIGARTQIADKAQIGEGAILGDDCIVGHGSIIHSNVKVWPHKRIEDGAVLSTSLIWGDIWSRRLFGAYGITGLCNREITPELATRIGAAYGAYLGEGSYVTTSRDAHMASRMIKRAFISGLLSTGVKVGDLRTAPIPSRPLRNRPGRGGRRRPCASVAF